MTFAGPGALQRSQAHQATNRYSYSPSISASASSSSSSVFSVDGQSSQSSAPSSPKSVSSSWENDSHSDDGHAATVRKASERFASLSAHAVGCMQLNDAPVPPQLRLHPRRTCLSESHGSGVQPSSNLRQPPSLVRQCDRKDNFVETLVDTTTQMIEVIWPLSVVPCGRDTVLGGKNLIGLRTFIQEVLKRSKTSYSTLQVALYYLILIKPCIPKVDFTNAQSEETHASRAMQCGRRMFLAALILASKYLQDRNYSARAWSKISGLKIAEINSNEIAFVTAIDWRLHVPEARFQRWSDVVLKFSQLPSSPTSPQVTSGNPISSWRSIIPRLTPELENIDLDHPSTQLLSSDSNRLKTLLTMSPPPKAYNTSYNSNLINERPSIMMPTKPQALEPTPCAAREQFPFPPISPSISQLPTPQITPGQKALCTPAVSCKGPYSGSAMRGAMKQIHNMSILRSTVDVWPTPVHDGSLRRPSLSRLPSCSGPNSSVFSSPESMISDSSSISFQTSRSSSTPSTTLTGAIIHSDRSAHMVSHQRTAMEASKSRAYCEETTYPQLEDKWTSMGCFAGSAPESYVRGSQAACPTSSLTVSENRRTGPDRQTSFLRCQTPSCRKRERSCSRPASVLQNELKSLLDKKEVALGQENRPVVLRDVEDARSFMLHSQYRLSLEDLTSSSVDLDLDLDLRSRYSPRKRLRYGHQENLNIRGITALETPIKTNSSW